MEVVNDSRIIAITRNYKSKIITWPISRVSFQEAHCSSW